MAKGKRVAAAPKAAKAKDAKNDFYSQHAHLFRKNAKNFKIGCDVQPKRDLSRYVKWPRYVRIQRQRAILKKRIKVPPSINQFSNTLDKNAASNLMRIMSHYRPESKEDKKKRLVAKAQLEADNKEAQSGDKPKVVKFGINHVTQLVEERKAKIVVIAHDVDPIELVVWLPALCRKMEVPFCIVRGKARLGALVHQKNAAVVALTEVSAADKHKLDSLTTAFKAQYNDNVDALRKWGGGLRGLKSQAKLDKRAAAVAAERK